MYDVVVSGGGPAGAIAAYECARLGLDTVLLEKDVIPRKKCCAGGLLGRAAMSLPFELPASVVQKEIKGFAIEFGSYRKEFDFPDAVGYVLRRDDFDSYIIGKARDAGAQILQNARTLHVEEVSGHVKIDSTAGRIDGRLLIVAEGVAGSTARSLVGQYPRSSMAIGRAVNVTTERDPGDMITIHLVDTPTKRLRMKKDFPLNGWMFPHRRGANIGVVGSGVSKNRIEATLSMIREKVRERYGLMEGEEDLMAHPLPFAPRKVLHTRRSMIVGDAAGLVNPITGEGMSYALASGRMAAHTAVEVINEDKGLEHLAVYDSRCKMSIIRDIRAALFLSPFLHRIVGVVDTRRFFDNFHREEVLLGVCLGIARGEEDWQSLLLKTIPRFPRLFFSSLG
jgi:geranylgeranyl reductase family protein